MNSANAASGRHKQKHPERYCPAKNCLWRMAVIDHPTQSFSWPNGRWCPRHKHLALSAEREAEKIAELDVQEKKRLEGKKEHPGSVCCVCGKTVSFNEYSSGESNCCKADVCSEEEYQGAQHVK